MSQIQELATMLTTVKDLLVLDFSEKEIMFVFINLTNKR